MDGNINKIIQRFVILLALVYVSQSTKMFDISKASEHCMKGKAIEANYTPKGGEYEIGNITVYEAENRTAKRVVIAVYDIFGPSTNIKQVVDELSNMYNMRVVLPDFFRGHSWPEDDFPPEDESEFDRWLQNNGSWENIVKWDVINVVNSFITEENITEIGIFGLCWGGKVSTLTVTQLDGVKAAVLVHPSWVENTEAEGVKSPMYLLPSMDEPDMIPFYEVLQRKFGNNTGHRRFDDMLHGFVGARGNFSDPLIVQRVEEVIDIMGVFFNNNLKL